MLRAVFLFLTIFSFLIPCFAQETQSSKGKPTVGLAFGDLIGKAVKLPKPPFPDCNCKFQKKNKVLVRFTVDKVGNVESAEAISGHPALKAGSLAAIRNSKFTPSQRSGEYVKAFGVITYDFVFKKNKLKVLVLNYELNLEDKYTS